MPRGRITNTAYQWLRSMHERRLRWLSDEELCEPTVVVAPHQDDETLGCGGTIARKRKLGARVRVIFVTDGSRSHDGLIDRAELARLRADEAIAACETLGVHRQDVKFLGIENGALEQPDQRAAALRLLMPLLAADPPRQMLIPYHREPPPDHSVTTAIVLEAIARLEFDPSVLEYPIWFRHFWPFSWDKPHSVRELARRCKQTVQRVRPMLRELRAAVAIDHVLEQKRAALREHASQTSRLRGSGWPILDDVSDGMFTELFFQPIEVFYERTRMPLSVQQAIGLVHDVPAAEVAT